ncbi:uncharacterized protein ACR2FA_001359 [Aphomia sociella]
MTDCYREQRPLLNENISDDDHYNPHYQRRFRPMALKNRSKNKLKGAAAILKRWPNHWSTAFIYWWILLGMFAIITFIIYNGFVAFALLPSEHVSGMKPKTISSHNAIKPSLNKDTPLPNVYMHLLIDSHDNVDLNKYLPYIEIISNKYFIYNYRFILVFNDTNYSTLSAEENNDMALNLLWDESFIKPNMYSDNVVIEHTTLSKLMDNSPLRKYWKSIPHQFIEFLIRAISIWDRGGIAFNPKVLTPQTPNPIYIEKIQNILTKHGKKSIKQKPNETLINKKSKVYSKKSKNKVNNIQDVIEALERDDNLAYNHYIFTEGNDNHTLDVTSKINIPTVVKLDTSKKINVTKSNNVTNVLSKNLSDKYEILAMAESNTNLTNVIEYPTIKGTNVSSGLLPLFLNFLFNDRINNTLDSHEPILTRKRKNVISVKDDEKSIFKNYNNTYDKYRPMIIPPNEKNKKIAEILDTKEVPSNNVEELTVDLKGNIIATEIPCHAFLGTVFNNIVHHNQDKTVTDYLIQELSLFCKGLLSKCNGIDVILL